MLNHDINSEAILTVVGAFGPYQILSCIFLFIPVIFTSSFILAPVFTAATPDFTCYSDKVYEKLLNITSFNWSPCNCPEDWVIFDSSVYAATVATKWNLICENRLWLPAAQSMVFAGVLVGGFSFGAIASRFGRKNSCIIAIVIMGIFGFASAYSSNFYFYLVCQFLAGFGESGLFQISHVLSVEIVSKDYRVFCSVLLNLFLATGFLCLAGVAWCIRQWQWILITISVPPLICLAYFPLMDESFRWLLSQKRYAEAEVVLRRIARINGRKFPEDLSKFQIDRVEEKRIESFKDIFLSSPLRFRILALFYGWFFTSLCYYGLSMHSTAIAGDVYLNFTIVSLAEFPGYLLSYIGMHKLGRRCTVCLSLVFVGIACLLQTIDSNNFYLVISTSFFGKICSASAFGTIYLFTIELFPTSLRTSAVGACSVWSYAASIIAPYFSILSLKFGQEIPELIFGFGALIAGTLMIFFPETKNYEIPATIEEAESFGKPITERTSLLH